MADALQWLATQMQEQYGLHVNIQTNKVSTQFEDSLGILLFHAVHESVFNVVKHAGTLHAAISIEELDGYVQIKIHDGGDGFRSETIADHEKPTGGLMRIRHRLNLMGCNLQVLSQPGQGTQVRIDNPAQQDNA